MGTDESATVAMLEAARAGGVLVAVEAVVGMRPQLREKNHLTKVALCHHVSNCTAPRAIPAAFLSCSMF